MEMAGLGMLPFGDDTFSVIFEHLVGDVVFLWSDRSRQPSSHFRVRVYRSIRNVVVLGWVCRSWRQLFAEATDAWERRILRTPQPWSSVGGHPVADDRPTCDRAFLAMSQCLAAWPAAKRLMLLLPLLAIAELFDDDAYRLVEILRVGIRHPEVQATMACTITSAWSAREWAHFGGISTGQYDSEMDCVLGSFPSGFNYPYVTVLTVAAAHCFSSRLLRWFIEKILPPSPQWNRRDLSHLRGALRSAIDANRDSNALLVLNLLESHHAMSVPAHDPYGWTWLFRRALNRKCAAVVARIMELYRVEIACTAEDFQLSLATMDIEVSRAILESVRWVCDDTRWQDLWEQCIASDRVDALALLLSLDEGTGYASDSDQDDSDTQRSGADHSAFDREGFAPDQSALDSWSRWEGAQDQFVDRDPLVKEAYEAAFRDFLKDRRDRSALSARSLLLACRAGASSVVKFLLEKKVLVTSAAVMEAARQATPQVMGMLLQHARQEGSLRRHLMNGSASREGGVLHELCKCQKVTLRDKEACFRVICDILAPEKSPGLSLDELSWFDEHDHLPIHYATGPFQDVLARLFPADALWNLLEIDAGLLQLVGDIHLGGHSKASIQKWSYIDESCQVVVKRYSKSKMQEIKRELGIMSRVRFPYIVHMLGWCALKGDDIGVVMHVYACNLFSVRGKCSFEQKCRWMRQVGAALKYMHAQRPCIVHGDIHPMNVLLSAHPFDDGGKSHAVLCDFDFSSIQGTKQTQQSRLSLFGHLFRKSECEDRSMDERDFAASSDWILFGFLLFSVSSSWNWRDVQQRPEMEERVGLFLTLEELEAFFELPCGAFTSASDFMHCRFDPTLRHDVKNLDNVSSQLRALEVLPWGKWTYRCHEDSEPGEQESLPSA